MDYKTKVAAMNHYVGNITLVAKAKLLNGHAIDLEPEGDIVKCLELINKPWKSAEDIYAFCEAYQQLKKK